MTRAIDISVVQTAASEGVRRTVSIDNLEGPGRSRVDLHFDLVGEFDVPPPTVLDGFVVGAIFCAMRHRQPLRIHGALSHELLANLNELQEAWHMWLPQNYQKVEIRPDELVNIPSRAGSRRAMSAFSGGVDSTFTLMRHAAGWLGQASYRLDTVLMVHGFDVDLADRVGFDLLITRVRPLLDELGLKLKVIRTNSKALKLYDWQDSHASQLAACLHNYSHEFSTALIGASEPYSRLILPWGSNPATDYLMSGGAFRIVHDGAGFTRTDKVVALYDVPTACRALKVCWQGKEQHKNCGECEKCVRTQVNFLAAGTSHAPCFDRPFDLDKIRTIPLRNDYVCGELASIWDYAQSHSIDEPWVELVKTRVDQHRTGAPSGTIATRVKGRGKRFLRRMANRVAKLKSASPW